GHPRQLEVRVRDKFFVDRVVEEAVRGALGPLAAASPLGVGGEVSGVGGPWAGLGALMPGAAAPELFPGESLTPETRHLTPPLLQVFDTYILFQADQGVAIVDQHSAHERVLYEDVMRQLSGDGAPAQRLLLPLTLDFAPAELDAIEAHRELLARIGYEIEPFSGRSIVVHTAPNPHPRFEAARCLQELVADLAGGRFGGWQSRLERFAAQYACRARISHADHRHFRRCAPGVSRPRYRDRQARSRHAGPRAASWTRSGHSGRVLQRGTVCARCRGVDRGSARHRRGTPNRRRGRNWPVRPRDRGRTVPRAAVRSRAARTVAPVVRIARSRRPGPVGR